MVDTKLARRIIDLREEIDMTQTELARRLNIDKSAMSKIEKGTRKVSSDELSKLSEIFDASTDYILGKTDKRHYYSLTKKDMSDVETELENMINGIDNESSLSFFKNGTETSEQDRELLKASLRQTLILSHELAKKKFTPKKYRHGENE